MTTMTFTERLARRRRLWWDPPRPGSGRSLRDAVHRLRERRAPRSRYDGDAVWRCCAYWPRTLLNKWNGREFAARHGFSVPELYWHGDSASAPLGELPARFAIRPAFAARGTSPLVVADGRELLGGGPATPAALRQRLPRSRLGRAAPILIEELVEPHEASLHLPLEVKLHVFGAEVAAIEVLERRSRHDAEHRYYTPGWEPAPALNSFLPIDVTPRERPRDLDGALALGSALGAAIGTYMRIDLLLGIEGLVFGELSSLPAGGGHITREADAWFGELWSRYVPEATEGRLSSISDISSAIFAT